MRYFAENHNSTIIQVIIGCIIVALVIWFIDAIISSNTYNNGICKICGGTYEFQNAVGHQFTTDYIYKCNQCGDLIEINTYYKDD